MEGTSISVESLPDATPILAGGRSLSPFSFCISSCHWRTRGISGAKCPWVADLGVVVLFYHPLPPQCPLPTHVTNSVTTFLLIFSKNRIKQCLSASYKGCPCIATHFPHGTTHGMCSGVAFLFFLKAIEAGSSSEHCLPYPFAKAKESETQFISKGKEPGSIPGGGGETPFIH